LRDQGYSATTRFKVPYFQSDIDVFAEKGQEEKSRLYCECKFRINNNILEFTDAEKLYNKKSILLEKESKFGSKMDFGWSQIRRIYLKTPKNIVKTMRLY
jgi:hypothetical protein